MLSMQPRSERPLVQGYSALPIGLSKKSAPDEHERAMRSACEAVRGVDVPLPVMLGKRIIGLVKGRIGDPRVDWTTDKRWCGFATYDALINALTAGSKFTAVFTKTHTSAFAAANIWADLWPVGGYPAAGGYSGAAHTAKTYDDTIAGAMLHGGNVSAATKHIVSCFMTSSGGTPTLMLYDRCLGYEACAFNAAVQQNLTNVATLTRYTTGAGLRAFMYCQTTFGSTASNLTALNYTDDGGNSGAVVTTPTIAITVSLAVPSATLGARIATTVAGPFLPLAAGDSGLRSISNFTTSAANTGTFGLILCKPLLVIPIGAAGVTTMMDTVMQVANLERVMDGACISSLVYAPATTATTFNGGLEVAWA